MSFWTRLPAAAAYAAGMTLVVAGIAQSQNVRAAEPAGIDPTRVCKAAIAAIMHRDPGSISASGPTAGSVRLRYIRDTDGTPWAYRCRLEGDRVIWASDTGRWRTDPADDVIHFSANATSVTITEKYSDGSSNVTSYEMSRLK